MTSSINPISIINSTAFIDKKERYGIVELSDGRKLKVEVLGEGADNDSISINMERIAEIAVQILLEKHIPEEQAGLGQFHSAEIDINETHVIYQTGSTLDVDHTSTSERRRDTTYLITELFRLIMKQLRVRIEEHRVEPSKSSEAEKIEALPWYSPTRLAHKLVKTMMDSMPDA